MPVELGGFRLDFWRHEGGGVGLMPDEGQGGRENGFLGILVFVRTGELSAQLDGRKWQNLAVVISCGCCLFLGVGRNDIGCWGILGSLIMLADSRQE